MMRINSLYIRFLAVFLVSVLLITTVLLGSFIIYVAPKMDIISISKYAPAIALMILTVLLMSVFNIIWFRRSVMKPISSMETGIGYLKKGEYYHRIRLSMNDEFSDIAETFNDIMEKLAAFSQAESEKKKTQENIIKLLNVLSAASEGDLSQRAEVTPDVSGSLSDAFNLMVSGLSDLIKGVKLSAEDAREKSIALSSIIPQLENGAQRQTTEVQLASEAVDLSAASAKAISDRTKTAQRISEGALAAINKGSTIVADSIDGMQLIRATVQAINKRMKNLSEKLMEIGTISHLITEFADRTNLLALNASIEAARAGEQGKGFIVIAEEIRGLADRAAKSTKQIGEIINNIQTEAAGVTKHLEEETKHVEMETIMATNTGTIFDEIATTIQNIGSLIAEINQTVEGQQELTAKVVTSMEEVRQISLQILSVVHDFMVEISNSLSISSTTILSSTTRFKL